MRIKQEVRISEGQIIRTKLFEKMLIEVKYSV